LPILSVCRADARAPENLGEGFVSQSVPVPLLRAAEAFYILVDFSLRRQNQIFPPGYEYGQAGLLNNPPSTQMVCPVMNSAASLARNTTARPTSNGSPTRPSGVNLAQVPA